MATTDTTNYAGRPKGRPVETLKGKLSRYDNGYAVFAPQGKRESQRQMLAQLGDSSFSLNPGKKESSYSLHLNVDASASDPVAELFQQFLHLTAAHRKTKPQMLSECAGRMLLDNGNGLQIWLDDSCGKVIISAQLDCNSDVERELLQAEAAMNVCIARNRLEIANSKKSDNNI